MCSSPKSSGADHKSRLNGVLRISPQYSCEFVAKANTAQDRRDDKNAAAKRHEIVDLKRLSKKVASKNKATVKENI
jgi:hypothetical protein